MTNNPSPELLPCPFCGTAPWSGTAQWSGTTHTEWAVQCFNSHCSVKPAISRRVHTQLVSDWNTRAALTAIRPSEQTAVDGWRPIETAPKDGDYLLLASGENVTTGRAVEDGRWFETNSDPTDYWDGELHPTHWQPLPAAPGSTPTDHPPASDEMVGADNKAVLQLATYLSGSNVAAASIGLQLGGHALTLAQPFFALREALGVTGYATREEAADAILAALKDNPHPAGGER